jgi:hypothetical protein
VGQGSFNVVVVVVLDDRPPLLDDTLIFMLIDVVDVHKQTSSAEIPCIFMGHRRSNVPA